MRAHRLRPMSKLIKPLSIFRPGTHISAAGAEMSFTESDLAATAAAYDPTKHKAPLVLGHPKDNSPAYGWTKSLSFSDGLLQAIPESVSDDFKDWVNAGYYKKISASFYPPESPSNPTPGVFALRHIGFLGGQPPAVKGLPEPEFKDGDADFITVEFEERTTGMIEEEKRLAADKERLAKELAEFKQQQADFTEQQAALKQQQVALAAERLLGEKRSLTEFVETQIKAGKILPKDKLGAIEFMGVINSESVLEFGEGDTVTKTKPLDWFKKFIEAQPAKVNFGEATPSGGFDPDAADNAVSIANAASEYQETMSKRGVKVGNVEAINFVMKQRG